MYRNIRRPFSAFIVVLLGAHAGTAGDSQLSLDRAVYLALTSNDPYLQEPATRAAALLETGISEGQLPDPKVRLAFANWPTNSFSYSQEPMTQLQLGLSQSFPRGATRQFKQEKRAVEARSARHMQGLRRLEIELDTRKAWLDLYYLSVSKSKVLDSRQAVSELISITQSNFAAGKNKSQDIFRAEMELALLDDRLIEIERQSDAARARLARRIGAAANQELASHPILRHPTDLSVLSELLSTHPAVQLTRSKVDMATKDVAIAGEQYKPGWTVNVGYGARGGDRADFASVGVTMDVPLFTKNRQDRKVSAAKKMRQAQRFSLDATLLDLRKKLTTAHANWSRTGERITLYQDVVRQRAAETAEASLASYQSGVTDFSELIRARLAELNTELMLLRLKSDKLKAQAELLFLEGEYDA